MSFLTGWSCEGCQRPACRRELLPWPQARPQGRLWRRPGLRHHQRSPPTPSKPLSEPLWSTQKTQIALLHYLGAFGIVHCPCSRTQLGGDPTGVGQGGGAALWWWLPLPSPSLQSWGKPAQRRGRCIQGEPRGPGFCGHASPYPAGHVPACSIPAWLSAALGLLPPLLAQLSPAPPSPALHCNLPCEWQVFPDSPIDFV